MSVFTKPILAASGAASLLLCSLGSPALSQTPPASKGVTALPERTVTTYPVTDEVPLLVGGVQLTVAAASLLVAFTPVGASGVPTLLAEDAAETGPVPATFAAATSNV